MMEFLAKGEAGKVMVHEKISDQINPREEYIEKYSEMREYGQSEFGRPDRAEILEPDMDMIKNSSMEALAEEEREDRELLENILGEYLSDLRRTSDCEQTIPKEPFGPQDLEKLTPQETAEKREEFDDLKTELKREWEEKNGCKWPTYEQDVYSESGKLIRKAGGDYDAHHIQPLSMGGENEVDNITPVHAESHYDRQGIHAPDSAYSRLDQMLSEVV